MGQAAEMHLLISRSAEGTAETSAPGAGNALLGGSDGGASERGGAGPTQSPVLRDICCCCYEVLDSRVLQPCTVDATEPCGWLAPPAAKGTATSTGILGCAVPGWPSSLVQLGKAQHA